MTCQIPVQEVHHGSIGNWISEQIGGRKLSEVFKEPLQHLANEKSSKVLSGYHAVCVNSHGNFLGWL